MKQIDEFVNSIYANVSGKEAKEMKEEMQTHLIETVEELKEEGKSEQEAISIAINRFGDKNQITKGLLDLFKAQNKIVKILYRIAFTFLIIGLGILISLIVSDKLVGDKQLEVQDTLNSIINMPGDKELSEAEKNQIILKFQEITDDKLVNFSLYKKPEGTPEIIDRGDFPKVYSEMKEVIKYGQTGNWFFSNENKNWYAEVGYIGAEGVTLYAIPLPPSSYYLIPYSFIIIFIALGLLAFMLKRNSNRKMLNIFLKD